ncbi:MAG TPA: carboxypeptidase-like regulatory domain-containing protein [Vicinamibacterales bacterium]|nr:carboxypeptidase-like regulatory domain-containing protein [Vicinamibacterales bacterium]
MLNALVLLATLGRTAPQLDAETRSAVVSGRVIDAATGRPIPGVVVIPAGPAVPSANPPAPTPGVMTNGNGQFVIRGLRSGSLFLTATKGGYVPATYNQRRPGGSGQTIPLKPGQRVNGLDVRMWKHGAISGTVLDETGDPVVNARVQAMGRTFVAGRRRATAGPTTFTDDRGMYRIAGLTPGDYVIVVPSTQTSVPTDVMESFFTGTPISDVKRMELGREMNGIGSAIAPAGSPYAMKAGGQTISLPPGTLTPIVGASGILIYPTVYYPAAPTAAQATAVTVGSGEERSGIDLQLRPARGVRISGTVIGPEGPAATTGLHLALAGGDDTVDALDVAAALTDSAGGFTFPAVPAGQYVLRVVRVPRAPIDPDEATRTTTPAGTVTISSTPRIPAVGPPLIPADATLVAQMPISVGDRDLPDVIVPLAPGPRVSGRIEFEGTIEKPSIESLTNIRITLDPADGTKLDDAGLALQTGRPDETGQFKTYGVPPGRYVLRVSVLPAGWSLKSALYQGRDIADLPVDLESKDAAGVVMTFTDRPSRLDGVVQDATGPDPTAIVIVFPVESAAWSSAGALSRRMRTARAGVDGVYSMQSLPAGEYYVAAVKEDRVWEWQDPALLQSLSRVAGTIRLFEGEQKTMDLRSVEIR